RVPDRLTRTKAANRDAVLDDVGDDVDFGAAFDEAAAVFLDRRLIELTELPAERHEVVVAQLLPADEDDLVGEPATVERLEGRRIQRTQIHAGDFGAERCAGRHDGRVTRHGQRLRIRTPQTYSGNADTSTAACRETSFAQRGSRSWARGD